MITIAILYSFAPQKTINLKKMLIMKKLLRAITPPIIWRILKSIYNNIKKQETSLFDGDDALFKTLVSKADIYGEYGVGQSTSWVFKNSSANILSVDTSKEWIEKVKSNLDSSDRLKLEWIDLGELGDWGRPVNYSKRENIYKYIESIWGRDESPELVLIDGRFRVCCFLYSLIKGNSGTKIIFDDYTNRPYYHVIEEFISPVDICGRQALFIIPDEINLEEIEKTMKKFMYVMD